MASPLDPSEQPLAVSAAYGNVDAVDAAELTAARYCTEPLQLERWEAAANSLLMWAGGGPPRSALAKKSLLLFLDGYMSGMASC